MKHKIKLLLIPLLVLLAGFVGGCKEKVTPPAYIKPDITVPSLPVEDSKESYDIIDFYSVNDFHGRIQPSYKEPGIAKLSQFLKNQKVKNHGFVNLNAGDHFQDTYDSGTNRGNLLAESLPFMECEAMAIGNHEFDWGLDKLKENRKLAGDTAFLGANIYHYDEASNKVLDFASDIADQYKIINRGGHKIGLIGIIGEDQITSITSTIVKDLIFVDPIKVVPDLCDKLRLEDECEAVVLVAHTDFVGLGSVKDKIIGVSDKTNKRYIDAVFNAHTHKKEIFYENGVAFLQAGAHGEAVSKISLDLSNNEVKTVDYKVMSVDTNTKPDKAVEKLVNSYLTDAFYSYKNLELGTINGASHLSRKVSGNLLAKATYEALPREHKDVVVVFNNGGRSSVNLKDGSKLTPGLIYDALPFTNKTYVAMIKGEDLMKLLLRKNSYYSYYAKDPLKIEFRTYYKVATIDYVLFHKNVDRDFDRLPSFTGEVLYEESRYSNILVEEYLLNNPSIDFRDIATSQEFDNLY